MFGEVGTDGENQTLVRSTQVNGTVLYCIMWGWLRGNK